MAETAITTVLAKVAELVAWEAAVLLEVGDDVRLLRDKLEDDLEEYTVGFGKYSDMLKEQLLDVDTVPGRALVSIVGESSIGKTTLARKVYQSPEELPAEWDQVMAQLLAAKDQPQHCKSGSGGARRIMSLAFDDLPHHLKSCFLYFAAMPESAPVDAARLVRLWVAEGFVRPRRGSTMEEVGQGYLKELISRCMVQLVDKDEFGTVTAVVVHDRLHAFAQEEAQDACFVESHDSTDVLAPATVRRLAVQNTTDRHVHLGNALPKLRTIVCDFANGGAAKPSVCIHSTDLGFLHASKFLRVIDIHGLELKKLPDELGSMIHIRYLGLQCGQLERLPSTISKLVNLQSLILKGRSGGVLGVTAAFWTIPTLRHVVAPFALPRKPMDSSCNGGYGNPDLHEFIFNEFIASSDSNDEDTEMMMIMSIQEEIEKAVEHVLNLKGSVKGRRVIPLDRVL
uniref:Putative late blight resistance protein-R1B-16-like protein n=1 Tax=Aegilops tauschii TaxID=37682 RepID=M8BR94_AEGTA